MKVKMLVDVSGTRNGEAWPKRGEVADLPTDEAQHLVTVGMAEEAEGSTDDSATETATAPDPGPIRQPDPETTQQPDPERRPSRRTATKG